MLLLLPTLLLLLAMQLDLKASEGEDVFKQQDTFKLRWFTPAIEVPLCGHATLASAAVVFEGMREALWLLAETEPRSHGVCVCGVSHTCTHWSVP